MTYCYKCGAKLDEGTIFCPSCGTRQPNTGSKSESEGNIFDKVKDTIKDTPDYSSQIDPRDVNDNKLFAILAYFGLLVLVPIFAAPKKSRYARFHANQGLVLMIFDAVYNVITSIINTALG
ncbi:MAG: zinc-ribbon domain-containing protein, partial [Clostridia bacterium]|nr:zinc-ribbon domain-containing protein [Clostridia bacterium]